MKRLRFENGSLDAADVAILRALAEDARVTMAELGRIVGLSAPSVTERVRRLEEAGVVLGYAARIDPAALGLPLAAYVRIRPMPGQLNKVAEVISGLDGGRGVRPGDRRGLLHRQGACALHAGAGGGDRPDHSVRHDQHVDHPVFAGGAAAAAASGRAPVRYGWLIALEQATG